MWIGGGKPGRFGSKYYMLQIFLRNAPASLPVYPRRLSSRVAKRSLRRFGGMRDLLLTAGTLSMDLPLITVITFRLQPVSGSRDRYLCGRYAPCTIPVSGSDRQLCTCRSLIQLYMSGQGYPEHRIS